LLREVFQSLPPPFLVDGSFVGVCLLGNLGGEVVSNPGKGLFNLVSDLVEEQDLVLLDGSHLRTLLPPYFGVVWLGVLVYFIFRNQFSLGRYKLIVALHRSVARGHDAFAVESFDLRQVRVLSLVDVHRLPRVDLPAVELAGHGSVLNYDEFILVYGREGSIRKGADTVVEILGVVHSLVVLLLLVPLGRVAGEVVELLIVLFLVHR